MFFSPISWETQIGSFEKYGLQLKGRYSGVNGMAEILHYVFTNIPDSLYNLKYRKLAHYIENDQVTSLLEVFPSCDPNWCLFDADHNRKWNRKMTEQGKNFKLKKGLVQKEIGDIRDFLPEIKNNIKEPFYQIPSDTGKTVLRKDGTLVAAQDIKEGQEITYVPHTLCETISNQRVLIDTFAVTLVKKAFPFCGLGGFVGWVKQKEAKCVMMFDPPFIALFILIL